MISGISIRSLHILEFAPYLFRYLFFMEIVPALIAFGIN